LNLVHCACLVQAVVAFCLHTFNEKTLDSLFCFTEANRAILTKQKYEDFLCHSAASYCCGSCPTYRYVLLQFPGSIALHLSVS